MEVESSSSIALRYKLPVSNRRTSHNVVANPCRADSLEDAKPRTSRLSAYSVVSLPKFFTICRKGK